ncbi:MAG TPA: hypothetical protein VM115_03425 [Vicinamibacterales bacterium]|nr:hypothetical protein [Vicinamibacterales bacterium]
MICLGTSRRRATQHIDMVRHELHRQRSRDMRRDVGLQVQRLADRPVVRFGPEMCFGSRFDELRGDTNAIAVAADAAFEQEIG